jgi:hypothetical protein
LEPRVTMALIHDERYWKRACEEGRGWLGVDVRSHGGSWKQAFAELFVSESLRTFGVYPTQPPGWDFGFLRPPMDARHAHWEKFHPNGPVARPDAVLPGVQGVGEGGAFMPWRERFCSNAQKNGECGVQLLAEGSRHAQGGAPQWPPFHLPSLFLWSSSLFLLPHLPFFFSPFSGLG